MSFRNSWGKFPLKLLGKIPSEISGENFSRNSGRKVPGEISGETFPRNFCGKIPGENFPGNSWGNFPQKGTPGYATLAKFSQSPIQAIRKKKKIDTDP